MRYAIPALGRLVVPECAPRKLPMLKLLIACSLLLLSVPQAFCEQATTQKPNILWIIPDDMSANFSCYGESAIETPNVDRLAKAGVKFTDAVVTAPVCSTCRSAFITGMYQTSIGAHHHRSGRGKLKIQLQPSIKMVPELFQDGGYYTSISGWPITNRQGKTDYNFEWDPKVYDGVDWADRKEGQPFFAQIMTPGGKLRGKARLCTGGRGGRDDQLQYRKPERTRERADRWSRR